MIRIRTLRTFRSRLCCAPLFLLALLCGCALLGRRVELAYEPSRNAARAERKTVLSVVPFADRREERGLGRARSDFGFFRVPLLAGSGVGEWVTSALSKELEASGYKLAPESEWKLGGTVLAAACEPGKRIVCRVKLNVGLRMKDGWKVLDRQYQGEGARPPLFRGDDLYRLSLMDALQDVLGQVRRDVELASP
ncbi:MAG: hypothetical protein HY553_02995 [Elusimicrobia bacterium]|nr:hypothetical protein [Elusimicrobiota bacterium]